MHPVLQQVVHSEEEGRALQRGFLLRMCEDMPVSFVLCHQLRPYVQGQPQVRTAE